MLPFWDIIGEGAVTSQFYRRGKGIKVGDLVLFKVPINDSNAIKRVAGLPGDYVLSFSPESGRDEMTQVSYYADTDVKGHGEISDANRCSSRFPKGTAGFWETTCLRREILGYTGQYQWL